MNIPQEQHGMRSPTAHLKTDVTNVLMSNIQPSLESKGCTEVREIIQNPSVGRANNALETS